MLPQDCFSELAEHLVRQHDPHGLELLRVCLLELQVVLDAIEREHKASVTRTPHTCVRDRKGKAE